MIEENKSIIQNLRAVKVETIYSDCKINSLEERNPNISNHMSKLKLDLSIISHDILYLIRKAMVKIAKTLRE